MGGGGTGRGPGGGGCTRNTEKGKRGALWCTLEPSLRRGKHPRLSLRAHKGKVVAEISLICSFKRTCVRRVKISVGDNFPVKCKKSVCGLQIQLYIHSSPCTILSFSFGDACLLKVVFLFKFPYIFILMTFHQEIHNCWCI